MRKKLISFLLLMMICIGLVPNYSFAADKKEGKVIYISINRTNLDNLQEIPVLNEKLKTSGYIGLMNVKGDQGNSDERSYASIGAACRSNIANENVISFSNLNDKNGQIFKSVTGVEPKEINPNIPSSVNKIIMKALKKDPTLRYQTSTEMLQDLRACLKNPNGNFVEEKDYDETAKTQRINVSELEENKRVSKEDKNSDNKFIAFIKEHKKLSIFIGVILLFFIAFGGTMLFLGATNPKEVELPNITGMTAQEAEETLKKANLKYELEKEEYNKDVEEGKVISQEPPYQANFKVKEGSQVKVVISKGQEKTKVPKVVGMKQDEAVKALEEAKLKYEIVEEASKKVEEGYVISQETEADADAFAGDTVKIHVSTGTEKVTMVSVLDKSEEDAKAALKAIGITSINTVYEENSSKAKGVVLKQSVEPGSTVEKDSKITITVNNYEASNTINLVINVKSLTGGYTESTTNSSNVTNSSNATNTTTTSQQTVNKKVDVSVSVGGTVVQTRTNIDKNQTDLSIQVDGKGTQTVTVNAGGAISTKTINFAGTEKTIKIP